MRSRRGLTLIELLVVIVIVVALFAIVAAVGPHFGERQRTNRGASQLQGWLLIVKQRALRDYAPRGIRLVPPIGSQHVRQLQYIEQPDPYQPTLLDPNGTAADLAVQSGFASVKLDFSTAASPAAAATVAYDALWPPTDRVASPPIPPDVVLEFYGRYPGQPRRVLGIQNNGTNLLVTLDNKFEPNPPTVLPPASKEYRLYRKAQPIAGEPILQMPRDIAIDISSGPTGTSHTWYRIWPDVSYGNQPLDILFDQTGQVIGTTGRAANRISLWVRDVSLGDPGPDKLPPGDNVLITIYTRSGLIASHPVDDTKLTPGTNWNPFSFTQDGKSSGM